jgi:nickel transport protein
MRRSSPLCLALIAVALLACHSVDAHGANVFAWVEDGDVVVRANFGSRQRPAMDCPVSVYDADGALRMELKTDARGECRFPRPSFPELRIVVDAGAGHRCEARLSLTDAAVATTPAPDVEPDAEKPLLGRAALGLGVIAALTAAGLLILRSQRGRAQ